MTGIWSGDPDNKYRSALVGCREPIPANVAALQVSSGHASSASRGPCGPLCAHSRSSRHCSSTDNSLSAEGTGSSITRTRCPSSLGTGSSNAIVFPRTTPVTALDMPRICAGGSARATNSFGDSGQVASASRVSKPRQVDAIFGDRRLGDHSATTARATHLGSMRSTSRTSATMCPARTPRERCAPRSDAGKPMLNAYLPRPIFTRTRRSAPAARSRCGP